MKIANLAATLLLLFACVTLLMTTGKMSRADIYGTDCQDNYSVGGLRPLPPCAPEADLEKRPTGHNACSTSTNGKCCSYNEFNVYCKGTNGQDQYLFTTYDLAGAGASGLTCSNGHCQ